jgi:hypothetical protein
MLTKRFFWVFNQNSIQTPLSLQCSYRPQAEQMLPLPQNAFTEIPNGSRRFDVYVCPERLIRGLDILT